MTESNTLTRRDFLRRSAGATIISATGVSALGQETEKPQEKPRAKVILVRDEHVLDAERKINPDVIAKMLDDAMAALTGQQEPIAGWKQLLQPEDTVGIKTNAWRYLRTPPELEAAIKRRVMDVGIPEEKIDINDRQVLKRPGFKNATALINVRPMRTHDWSGVGSLIKNYIMFHKSPWKWHKDACADLAGLWEMPIVKGKTRLNILVMLTPLFHGKGPHDYQKKYTWEYKGLLVGIDPVAVDATGVRILEAKRRDYFGKDEPFPVSPKHIRVADEKYHLGVADPDRIEIRKLGWTKDVLI